MAQRLPPWKQMKRQEVNSESSDSNNVVNGGEFQQSNAVPSKSWKPTGNLMGSLNTSVNGESSEDGLPATAKTWKPSGSSSADQLSADRPQNSIFDSGERPPRIQVKVMNTPLSLTVDDLKSLFSPTGFIKHVKILPAREGRDSTLAFVQFNTQAEADAAIDQFNNFEVDGKTLRVMSDQKASNTGGSGFQGGFSSQNGESSARRPWGSGGHLNANGDGGSQDRFSGSDRVQVKVMNIPISLNKDDLESLFSPAGLVKQVKILPAREGRDSTLGYVHFTSQPEADAAIEQFNNFEVDGKTLRVMSADQKPSGGGSSDSQGGFSRGDSGGRRPWANPSGSTSGNDTMGSYDTSSRAPKPQTKVMGIPLTLTEDDIKALFSTAGFIKAVRILPVKEGRDSALGFIDWSTQEEVDAAVQQFNNYEIEGRTLRVFAVEPREERPPNPSGGGFSSGSIPWGNPVGNDGEQSRPWGNKVQGRLPRNAADQIDSRDSGNFNGGDTGKGCFKCGMEGHFARECPADMHCHQCGAPGHKSRECPEGGGGSRPAGGRRNFRNDDDGSLMNPGELDLQEGEERSLSRPPPVTYIPPALPDDEASMFEDTCHEGINFQKYEHIPVEVTGRDPVKGVNTFEEANLHEVCYENIRRAKYTKPTPVQKHAIPVILAKRDLMACAQTGSGKTAAFLLPVMTNLLRQGVPPLSEGPACPLVLIIVPVRELAIQIFQEARKFAYRTPVRPVVVYGGVSVPHQLQKLAEGCHILVATPGRLEDFVRRERVSLNCLQYLILDEADRMLDLGFGPQIQRIVENDDMPNREMRQTLMFSATFPESIQKLAAIHLSDYLFLTVGRVGGASSDINQTIMEIPGSEKRDKLEEILLTSGTDRTLVFVELKRSADFLASFLSQRNFPTTSISSDRSQEERERALRDFRGGRAPVLVATAVAARGLDIPEVKHVINYDLPSDIDEYVHRIGRTGRIGNQGRATAFFDRGRDTKIARGLVKVLSEANQPVPDWLEEVASSAIGTSYGPEGGKFSSRDRRERMPRSPRDGHSDDNRGRYQNRDRDSSSGFGGSQGNEVSQQSNGPAYTANTASKYEATEDTWD